MFGNFNFFKSMFGRAAQERGAQEDIPKRTLHLFYDNASGATDDGLVQHNVLVFDPFGLSYAYLDKNGIAIGYINPNGLDKVEYRSPDGEILREVVLSENRIVAASRNGNITINGEGNHVKLQ